MAKKAKKGKKTPSIRDWWVKWRKEHHSPIPPIFIGLGITLLLSQVIWAPAVPQRAFSIQELKLPINGKELPTPEYWQYFHPTWAVGDWWSELALQEKTSGPADHWKELYQLSADPENKVGFEVPESIRSRVTFWMLVQSKYSRRFRIVHDKRNPGIVYGIIDFRPLYRRHGITARLDVEMRRAEKAIVKELSRRLSLVGKGKTDQSIPDDQVAAIDKFLNQRGALGQYALESLLANVRTQTGQVDEFRAAIHRSRKLLPHVESVMARYKLPVGLSRIPFVESSFNEIAHSKVGAMGIWQFMPATAREMISGTDRKKWSDPLLQTRAAARLLRNYKTVLPDWGTTITAYNSGVGRIRRILRKHRLKNVEGLLALPPKDSLGFAGMNFFAQVLSANLVLAYSQDLLPNLVSPKEVTAIFEGTLPDSLIKCTF